MTKVSYSRYCFPPEIIWQPIRAYLRFTPSLRHAKDLLAERGVMVSYEAVRHCANDFGSMITEDLRKHPTQVQCDVGWSIPWRAVGAEGKVLDVLVQSRRKKRAELTLMPQAVEEICCVPNKFVADHSCSYGAAAYDLGISNRYERGWPRNNQAESSHQPTRRERKISDCRVRAPGSAQRFLSMHAAAHNAFNVQRYLNSARTHRAFGVSALQTWREVFAAAIARRASKSAARSV
jgi:transposase-like protein